MSKDIETSKENLRNWADLAGRRDNRIAPLLDELALAISETEDTELLSALASRLKFMSGSIGTLKHYLDKRKGW